ncbi:uncharacterized protein BDZ99DRAFT_508628 [Mytilinidion resinicola]|uniref:Uncharacterized protein n=1 Tax=Mytilinidion resinicola TaxID=574789 RepID=A0A6A6YPZ1_9PEZI|nr:uncharacterized protein BDZ99DRAFT_508628 [Mytilinidion resinicola]KAF2810045.1 hypothetical protein BDZ99DRAFT_508628 [Mytilinidion resinicola]
MQPSFTKSRKRAASSVPDASSLETHTPRPLDQLKRTRTEDELDAIDIIPAAKAWPVGIANILSSPVLRKPLGSHLQPHDNFENHIEGGSIFVVCVQGVCQLHYDLLCNALPDLYAISPTLQALVLCHNPSTHSPSTTTLVSLPLVEAIGASGNHFVRLGLLHPLGNGQDPLDALVVLDPLGRRRLLLPFGWGAGRHAGAVGGGRIVQRRFMDALTECVESLVKEFQDG